jgi:hypothetical protein
MKKERLTYRKTLNDGRVLAINSWATGVQELVYPDKPAFERAKKKVEEEGRIPHITGYTPVP